MEKPPLTEAPRGWLEAIVGDTDGDTDAAEFDVQIQSVEDGKDHTFTYRLGDIRDELRTRDAN